MLILVFDVKNLVRKIIIMIIVINNNNNNNESKSSNKSSTNNKDNVTSPSPSQNPKEIVFILGDGMVKKLNAFLLTRKFNHKYLVKVRPFRSAKVGCMPGHVKPTV